MDKKLRICSSKMSEIINDEMGTKVLKDALKLKGFDLCGTIVVSYDDKNKEYIYSQTFKNEEGDIGSLHNKKMEYIRI